MKRSFFIILLVGFFLGCTIPTINNGGTPTQNSSYLVVGIDSFNSEVDDISSGGITNVQLQITNYGSMSAMNVYAKLLGHEGQDITIEDEYNSIEELMPDSTTEFYWPMQMPALSVETDVVYVFDARVYYDYHTNASKEVVFMPGVDQATVTPHSASTDGPVGISLTALDPIRMNPNDDETEFTVTIRLQNIGQGYIGYLDESQNDITVKDHYMDSVFIRVPETWTPQHPDDWVIYDQLNDECVCPSGYSSQGSGCSDCVCTGCTTPYNCPTGSHYECIDNTPYCIEGDILAVVPNMVSHDFCPADYIATCGTGNAECCRTFTPICGTTGEKILALRYDEGDQDTRMRLIRGDHTTYSVGFTRDIVDHETVESIEVAVYYSYYIPTKNSVDITVRGQQQTY
jgi:hypothetical protein